MTIKELKESGHIIFECISGSRAYGLDTPESDTDIRGVYILPKDKFYGFEYTGQINNETNDITYYELRKFIELCSKNNPNIIEMLHTPEDCILYKHPIFDELKQDLFLSKLCKKTFGNYAFAQIKKARGLNKKVVNPMAKERKTVLDFCYLYQNAKSIGLPKYLKQQGLDQSNFGLSQVPNIKNAFNVYLNTEHVYHGIAREHANELCLSQIPKGEKPVGLLYFNLEGYSTYCKRYKEYWDWVSKRNEVRYQNNVANEKNYDAKNMMHTFRLLIMAEEIGQTGIIHVRRPDRAYLLDIKQGKFEYDDLVDLAEKKRNSLEEIYSKSNLPNQPDLLLLNQLLINLREQFYLEKE